MTNKEKFIDNTPFISFVEVITGLEYQLIKVYGKTCIFSLLQRLHKEY